MTQEIKKQNPGSIKVLCVNLESKVAGYIVKWESFEPDYSGFDCCHEGYWFTKSYEWAIYCSHENTITFAGSNLIRKIKEIRRIE